MKCYKEKELIIFDFENGKRATYNLNTGETIGKQGKPVQSLCSALAGLDIKEILNSFVDKKYADFLRYLFNTKSPTTSRYSWTDGGWKHEPRVKNLGVILKYANDYKIYEQYFIAGVDASDNIVTPLKDVPKGLLKLARFHGKKLDDSLIASYKKIPNEYNVAFSMEFENIRPCELWSIMSSLTPTCNGAGYGSSPHFLLHERKYNLKALLKYIDYLCTFEGLFADYSLVREIGDYAHMMHQISDKYEKYPRYFLSTHKIAARNYNRLKHQFDEKNFQKCRKPEYEMTFKDYVFIYPKTTQEIKDEAVQQNNCVASYIDRVINGSCHILFLRKKDTPHKSLVTIEVRNGEIVQARQAYNNLCTEEQLEAVDAFNKKFKEK
jgi:hypothetical protein